MNKLLHRKLLKWVHWLSAGLILYFVFVEPDLPERGSDLAKTEALSTHAGMGALLGLVVLFWMAIFAVKGAAGKPTPRMQGWQRTAFQILNKGLYYILPIFMMTGLAAGLAAPFLVTAFGWFPLNFAGMGSETVHGFIEEVHEISFDILLYSIIAHAAFHIWRHYRLKDNALRVMIPQIFHRYL